MNMFSKKSLLTKEELKACKRAAKCLEKYQ